MNMFIDICFPSENEDAFVNTAKRIMTDGLCFVYETLPKDRKNYSIKTYTGIIAETPKKSGDIIFSNVINKNKRMHFYYDHIPKFNHVLIKNLVMHDKLVGISFNFILRLLKDPEKLENLVLFIRLCRKYKAKLFLASFAKTPFELRNKNMIQSLSHFLGMDTKTQKQALEQLYLFFKPPL